MITREEIFESIQHILINTFEIEKTLIIPESNLFKDLGLDSFDAVDLAVTLEVDTGIKLKEEDMHKISNISDIVEIIYEKINKV